MRPRYTLPLAALVALGATLAVTAPAQAACSDRKVAGTVIGGVGGALVGNSISKGGGGAVVGGLGGAFLGNRIAASGCNRYRATSYRSDRSPRRAAAIQRAPAPEPVRYVYYDRYGNAVSAGPAPTYAASTYAAPAPSYATASNAVLTPASYGACRTENRAFYDHRGALIYRPVQTCDR